MIRRLLLFLTALVLVLPVRSEVRHLIIVDISQSMAPRKQATINMVRQLVASGFQGQIRAGDKYGIWVYNEHNYWKRFALQTWDPAKSALTAEVAAQFLQGQTFEKRNRFDLVATDLEQLFSMRSDILLNIITDGETGISGIDYDIEINTEMSQYRSKLGQARKPFMINLLALKGKIQSWQVYTGEGELDLPKLPPLPPVIAKTSPEKKAEEPKKEEKAPVVVEMPPGAKIVVPKPVETPAPVTVQTPPAPAATASAAAIITPASTINQAAKPASNPPVVIAAAMVPPKTETPKTEPSKEEPKASTASTNSAPNTNTVAVAAVDKIPSESPRTKEPVTELARANNPPVAAAATAQKESNATGPLFYCIAALGFLLPIAALLVYLQQRRAGNRGSIISQSMLRDMKSGML